MNKKKVLVVDDDMLLRRMCSATLRHAGLLVSEVENGEAAISEFMGAQVDLVLLDVQMPGLDGYETCQRLRQLPGGDVIPIIMLTGLDDSSSIERAYDAGATDFIAKPFHWPLLTQRVRYALRAAGVAEASRLAADSLQRAQRMAQLGSWSLGLGGMLSCSTELARIYGLTAGQLPFATAEQLLQRVAEFDRDRIRRARQRLADHGEGYEQVFVMERLDGAVRTVYEQAVMLRDARGQALRMEAVTQDITDRVDAERQIQQLSSLDGLTELPNRRFFEQLVASRLMGPAEGRRNCALLQLDLDRFKSVNDALGVAVGDAVLKAIANRLQGICKARDCERTRGVEAVLGRLGPNTFCIFISNVHDTLEVVSEAHRLLAGVTDPLQVGEDELRLTASMGIAMYPRDAGDAHELQRFAEQALYVAKRDARGNFLFFDQSISAAAGSLLVRETDLRRALSADEMRCYLQPKIDSRSGEITGAEALVRWEHPERGMVPPGEFIPLAENTGLIGDITEWMLMQVGRLTTAWRQAGYRPVPISVNISASWFTSHLLLLHLDRMFENYELQPDSLVLEVTESMLIRDIDKCIERMHELRARGISISLDDFGTGYSSLSYLKVLPLNEIKLDRSFVTDICRDRRDEALAASVVSLAHALDLAVVAEGVETEAQAQVLAQLGCHIHQGFLYGRPIPAAAFSGLLTGSNHDSDVKSA